MILSVIIVSLILGCECQNNCIKWLQSINSSYPYISAHNSYHIRQTKQFKINDYAMVNVTNPLDACTMPSITELLSNEVVGIEIDINPPDDISGENDFPVGHVKTYDTTSSCNTLRKCLTEINDWLISNNHTTSAPLIIYIDVKAIEKYTIQQINLFNSIWTEIFDINDLYTPSKHNNGNDLLLPYRDWSEVCYQDVENKIIPLSNDEILTNKNINKDILSNINMFLLCDCQTQAHYCIVLRNECEDETLRINATNRLKYLYRQWTPSTEKYIQWNQYPYVYNKSVQNILGFQVSDDLINEIHRKYPQYVNDVVNPLTVDQWQCWQTVAYLDAMNNNNGKFDKDDLLQYLKVIAPTQPMLDFTLSILFWKEDIDEWDILDPLLWAKIKCLWNQDYGLKEHVINANLSDTLRQICDQLHEGYHYLYTDYPYNFGDFQSFTLREIQEKNMCDNITFTAYIKESKITSSCVSTAELKSIIYAIIGGIFGIILILIIAISVLIYCCVCYKKGGCVAWCKNKCICCKAINVYDKKDELLDQMVVQMTQDSLVETVSKNLSENCQAVSVIADK